MSEQKDIRLVIEIKNKQPLELLDLTKSLVSLASQFNSYASKNGDSKENREAKLYVKEIRSGSIILELIEMATIGVIPFLENVNTIVGFADYTKKAFNYFLGKSDNKPDLTPTDYKELSQIVNPVANDNGSQINMSTTINGNVELHVHLDSLEANAIQNRFEKELKSLKIPEMSDDTKTKVLLTWFQARNDMKSNVGNKGTIEDLSAKPMNIVIDDDAIKDEMLHKENPFTTVFVVDVKLQHVNGKVVAYKVVKLHGSFDVENGQSIG
ncbi:MAG: hypothetical protein JSR97_12115 [Verrucomicrobia bacterium]|nr:hypothetical protein [Verrucomicrobiota bacterium]